MRKSSKFMGRRRRRNTSDIWYLKAYIRRKKWQWKREDERNHKKVLEEVRPTMPVSETSIYYSQFTLPSEEVETYGRECQWTQLFGEQAHHLQQSVYGAVIQEPTYFNSSS